MDHVFAETLFDTVPRDALTVPACRSCNESKAIGDEILHVVVTLSKDAMRAPGDIVHHAEIARAIKRTQSTAGLAAWRAYCLRKQVDPFRLGGDIPVPIDGAHLDTTLRMIVRGLFFKIHGRILPVDCPDFAVPLSQLEAPEYLLFIASDPDHHLGQRGNKTVQWIMSSTSLFGENSVACVLLFKGGVFYLCGTGDLADDSDDNQKF